MSINYKDIWETYQSSWKVETTDEKLAIFEKVLDKNAVYQDPLAKTTSWNELVAYMLEFHKQIPGGHFITTYFQAHSNQSVAKWNMVAGDGTVVGEGISYVTYSDTGKLTSMTGFFDVPAAGA